ncbi:MAG: hypothetical protein U9N10_02105, partial [Bacillota bacterium]|nr:hypothetical protein [Bacillota bacterium]
MRKIINEIKTRIINNEMINKNDKVYIDRFFRSKLNISRITELIQNENFDSVEILDVFNSLLSNISDEGLPENSIEQFYNVALLKSFPNVLDYELDEKYNKVSIIFLEILRCFIKYEK